jgi:hypothetical protein
MGLTSAGKIVSEKSAWSSMFTMEEIFSTTPKARRKGQK